MKIAVEGCAHGELDKIYETIAHIEQKEGYKVDLLLCCGDFQATRNLDDLNCMAVPKKYQSICTFYKYYSGEKVAPVLTIFIGGNHEASNYLQELPYGGWVAPNIYYLGYAGVVNYRGIRIGGLSGIYKGFDYFKGHFECSPFDQNTIRSVYHYRQLEFFRLEQLSDSLDVMMSHDWPNEVYNYGNAGQLIRFKPHFRDEIHDNKLGSRPCFELLKKLKPKYWFSGHLHCKFAATIPHQNSDRSTKFLALDKCLPNRRFLQVLEVETTNDDKNLFYDLEWLTILYTTKHLTQVKNCANYMPREGNSSERWNFRPTADEMDFVLQRMENNLKIPKNFEPTAAPYDPNDGRKYSNVHPTPVQNPQTVKFCDALQIDDPLNLIMIISGRQLNASTYKASESSFRFDETIDENETTALDLTVTSTPEKRTSLFDSLPAPKNESTLNPEETILNLSDADDDVDSSKKEEKDESEHETLPIVKLPEDTENEQVSNSKLLKRESDEDLSAEKTPAKKFIRRNASIYNAVTDD